MMIRLSIIFISIIIVLYLPILFVLKKKGIGVIRQLSYLALICSISLILFATIFFVPIVNTFTRVTFILGQASNFIPFGWLREPDPINAIIRETIPNIILFVPLGFFVPMVFEKARKVYKTAIIILLVTFSIEFFQYFLARSTDIDDLIANLLGGIIGYVIFKICNSLFKNKLWWDKIVGKDIKL